MQQINENIAIRNFVVFQDLMFHSIMLNIQHTPRVIAQHLRSSWHVPSEKAIYAYIHYQLSLLPFIQRLDLLNILRNIILRTSIFHIQRIVKEPQQNIPLYLNLLCAELNAALGRQDNFKSIIRSFNYGFVLLTVEQVYQQTDPTPTDLSRWSDWYYMGLKEFLYGNLACKKTEEIELLFNLSYLKKHLAIAEETAQMNQLLESKQQALLVQTADSGFQQFVRLI